MSAEGVWLQPALPGVVGTGFGTGLPDLLFKGGPTIAIRITDDTMTRRIGDRVVATARFREHAVADGTCPRGPAADNTRVS